MHRPHRRVARARVAVALGFMLSGVAFASWVVRIPDVQTRLGLSEGMLGLVLLAVALGGLVAMPLSSFVIARFGSRDVARSAALVLALSVALPPWISSAAPLALILLLLGASTSVLSVALNTQAAALERRMRRPIMAGLHALYSAGGLVGAGVGGLLAASAVSAGTHLAGAAAVIAAATLGLSTSLLGRVFDGTSGTPVLQRPGRPLALMGFVAFCVLFGEGALADWGAVYLRDAAGAGPGLAAAGYAAFSTMMAAGRLLGDALTLRLGATWMVRLGSATATIGMMVAVGQRNAWMALAGFAAVGAGLSTIFPTVLAAAGRVRGAAPASSIAVVSSMGYVGLLAGPPLIGIVAETTTLQIGFALVGLATFTILLMARVVPDSASFSSRRVDRRSTAHLPPASTLQTSLLHPAPPSV